MLKKLVKPTFTLIFALAILIALFIGAVNYGIFGHLYSKEEIKEFKNETATLIYSSDNKLLGKYFTKNRTNISFDQLPDHLVNALVATEDARYFEHEGVDSRSLLRVLFKTIILNDKSSGGGSTITQQLAKNMYGRKRFGPLTVPINKTKEAILANRIEEIFNKKEILSLYLNTVPFGENVYGIEAASIRFFNKGVEALDIEESAVLIGMLKANTYYNPRLYPEHALLRRNVVLNQMEKYDYINEVKSDSLKTLPLVLDYANFASQGPANYYLVHVKKRAKKIIKEYNKQNNTNYNLEKDGLIINTTLNYQLQKAALNAFKTHLGSMQKSMDKQYRSGSSKNELEKLAKRQVEKNKYLSNDTGLKNRELFSWNGFYTDSISAVDSIQASLKILQAGMVALDPKTGQVLCWVGGIDFRTQPYDQVLAHRQFASAFKPILYAAAFEEGMQACEYLDNDPIVLSDHEDWSPENYDHTFGGNYSLSGALTRSLNIPTVNLYFEVGYEALDYLWKKLGFERELNNSPSTALGTAEASLLEAALAYSAFANEGEQNDAKMILSIETQSGEIIYQLEESKSRQVIKDKSAQIMNEILQKAIDQGTGRSMRSRFGVNLPLAGKTGTSQNYSDAWFVCYNPSIVIASRVGASSPSIHFDSGANGSGSRLALPLAGYTLQAAQKNKILKKAINNKFAPPSLEIVQELDCPDYKEDSGMEKLFDSFRNETSTEKKKKKKATKKKKKKKKGFFKRIFD